MAQAKLGKTTYEMDLEKTGTIKLTRTQGDGKVTTVWFPKELLVSFAKEQMIWKALTDL